jgi:hypothetical protein
MLKEAIVAYFTVVSRHSPGGTEESHENLIQGSYSPDRDLNAAPTEHEVGVLSAVGKKQSWPTPVLLRHSSGGT